MPQCTNVLFIWDVDEELKELIETRLADIPDLNLIFPEEDSEGSFLKHAPDAHVIVGWRPTKELLMAAVDLKLLISPGVGVKHLIELFREVNNERQPIQLANDHGNTYYTAQFAVTLLMTLMGKVVIHHNWMIDGKWRMGDDDARSVPLRNRKIGFLGYGHINRQVHRFLSGYKLEFSALRKDWSKQRDEPPTNLNRFTSEQLHEFLQHIDILMIALPHTASTIGMIGKEELELLGEKGLLINVARGKIVDENALYEALANGTISGAAIDVWYDYRPEPDAEGKKYPYNPPFHELDNIILSPHRAASPYDSLERWDDVIENIKRVAEGRTDFLNIVSLDDEY